MSYTKKDLEEDIINFEKKNGKVKYTHNNIEFPKWLKSKKDMKTRAG